MSRPGMSGLIQELRGMTDAVLGQWTNGTANYWDNDQVQVMLDHHRTSIQFEQLEMIPKYVSGGSVQYFEYRSQYRHFEQTTGGTAVFVVEDSTGADVGTASYTPDYANGIVTFAANTFGTVYYLTGYSYDLHAAAADLWRAKASHYAVAYDIKTDNQALSRSQLMAQCLKMAELYDNMAGVSVGYMDRSDDV